MLYCGRRNDNWVKMALNYLPDDIFERINEKIAITVLNSDALRLAQKICRHEEIIILSPWIFPYKYICETDKEARYFIFCILHEVAHAVLKHSPPDELLPQNNNDQETEADTYALKWFNDYALENSNKGIIPIAIEEIREQQEKNQKRLESFLNCG